MSDAAAILAPPEDPSPEVCPTETRGEQRLALLRELADLGMDMARDVARRAKDPDAEGAIADPGLAFARIARAVRQTLALEVRFEEERETRLARARDAAQRRRDREASAPYDRRGRLVRRAALRAIEAEADDQDYAEQLVEALDERLLDREADEDFLDLPVSELVARICKDLGLRFDPSLWEDETWAIEEAAARAPPEPEPPPDSIPLIPATAERRREAVKAGPQTQDPAADGSGSEPMEPTSEPSHLGPGRRELHPAGTPSWLSG